MVIMITNNPYETIPFGGFKIVELGQRGNITSIMEVKYIHLLYIPVYKYTKCAHNIISRRKALILQDIIV